MPVAVALNALQQAKYCWPSWIVVRYNLWLVFTQFGHWLSCRTHANKHQKHLCNCNVGCDLFSSNFYICAILTIPRCTGIHLVGIATKVYPHVSCLDTGPNRFHILYLINCHFQGTSLFNCQSGGRCNDCHEWWLSHLEYDSMNIDAWQNIW